MSRTDSDLGRRSQAWTATAGAPRSYLYVPGYRPDQMDKAAASGADAVILDLEDAVPLARKAEARAATAQWLAARAGHAVDGATPGTGTHADAAGRHSEGADRPQLWVRVNPESLDDDVAAVAVAGLAGIVVPKASQVLLAAADAALTRQETRLGLPNGRFAILALIETARGVLDAPAIAAAPRVARLGVGAADLCAELGVRYDGTHAVPLAPLLLPIVLASAAAGLPGPMAPISVDFRDFDALRASTIALRELGFRARTCIHPAQLAVVADVFTPSPDEVRRAEAQLAAYDAAVADGHGVLTGPDGRLVDEAIARHAREVIARAPRAGSPAGDGALIDGGLATGDGSAAPGAA